MNEETNYEIASWINELMIKDELRESLSYFNEKINEIKRTGCSVNFDIIIDERSREDIDILLEYTTIILEKQGLYSEFVKYEENTCLSDIKNSAIVIDDFDVFYDRVLDYYNAEKKLSDFMNSAKRNNNILIFTCVNKIDDNFKKISKKIFDPELCIHLKRKNNLQLYNELIDKYNFMNIRYCLSYQTFEKIISSIENKEECKNTYIIDYLYDYSVKKMVLNNYKIINAKTFEEFIEKKEKKQSKIDSLIGLDNIKNELNILYKYLEFSKKLKIKDNMYLNLFFLGNPGTGKTTVAKMYAQNLYKMGYIKENKVIETVPTDLIGEYVGQTRNTIRKILGKAEGGVLFIDEAYLLYSDSYSKGKNPYMEEAIVELIKYLEDPKNVVIFAGYPEEMKKIYETNPGIKSRIYKEIVFNDYTTQELYQILSNDLEKKHLKIDTKSKNKIIKYIDLLKQENNFGNARTILSLGQKMIMNHASNSKSLLLDANDLPKMEVNKIKMGFGVYD